MRPYDVRSENDNLAMTSDNHPQDAERWSILNFADKVSLHPPTGTDWVGWVEIPRDQFNAIVDWYIKDQAPPATDHVMGSDLYQTDEEIRQWIAACNHEPAKASLRHYLDIRTSAETEQNRLRRMVERRDEFIIANGLWDAFKEASREAE